MQLHEPADQGQSNTEPALRPIERAFALHEQIEYSRQQLGRDAEPVVLHTEHRIRAFHAQGDCDPAPDGGVLHRIADDVRDNLLDPDRIAIDPAWGQVYAEM